MNPVAAIAYAAHSQAILTALVGTGASVYTLTREGKLKPVSGPPVAAVKDIKARHVVWVGVPPRWVKKLGPLKFKCHYVLGAAGRWHREKDSHRALGFIKAAQASVKSADKKLKKAREGARQQAEERARIAALEAAPGWYVPQELR
jgi:hypothetical protein